MSENKELSSKELMTILQDVESKTEPVDSERTSREHTEKRRYDVEDYDNSFFVPMKVLRVIGLRLMKKDPPFKRICWATFYWFEFINLFVPIWLEAIKMVQTAREAKSGSLEDVVGSFRMVPCIGYLPLGLTKTYNMKRNPSIYENMIRELRDMFPQGIVSEEEHEIVKTALTRLNYVNKGYYYYNNVTLFMFLFATYYNGVRWALGYDVPPILPFEYWFPFDPAGNVIGFMTILNFQIWHAVLSIWFSMCGDLLLCTFLTHITMQFDLLAARIRRFIYVPADGQLIPDYPLSRYSKERLKNHSEWGSYTEAMWNEKDQTELRAIVRRQHDLMRLAADVESMYSFPMLIHFCNSSIIICFCTFCSALVEKWNELGYKCFLFVAIWESLLLSWYGERLIESSKGVSDAVYNSGWYKASARIKNSILIMIVRSQKPLYITTYGFSVISLATFTTLIKTAWSYFTLILNLYNM